MTGPEHYREAERLIAGNVEELRNATENTFDEVQSMVDTTTAMAQVHATLALAAATAHARLMKFGSLRQAEALDDGWTEAIS